MNLTLLKENQIFGDNALEIFKKYGTKASVTDFAILLGAYVNNSYYTDEGITLKDRTGWWWTRSDDGDNDVRAVTPDGHGSHLYRYMRHGVVRPALQSSVILSSISPNVVSGYNEVEEVAYGEYPQWVVEESLSKRLEEAYNKGSIIPTGKHYITDSIKYEAYDIDFTPREHIEYEYNGEKYIRFVGDYNGKGKTLSDGRVVEKGKAYWLKVEPIIWLVDRKTNIAISKRLIVSGIQFNKKDKPYDGDFESTDIYAFMNNYLSKEIEASIIEDNMTEEEILEELKAVTDRVKRSLKLI